MQSSGTSPSENVGFEWTPPGVAVSCRISPAVLSGLRAAIAQPTSTEFEEFGGILLGVFENDGEGYITHIDSFEPFQYEHRYGPTFALSPRDQRRLRQRIEHLDRSPRRPVGLYRTHQRRGLYLDQRDFELFQSEFQTPASVFLLVRPDPVEGAHAGVFVWEGSDVRRHSSHLEFAVPAAVQQPLPVREPAPAPVVAAIAHEDPLSLERPQVVISEPRPRWSIPNIQLPKPAALPRPAAALGLPLPTPAQRKFVAIGLVSLALPLGSFYFGRTVGMRETATAPAARRATGPGHAARRATASREPAAESPSPAPPEPAAAVPESPAPEPPAPELSASASFRAQQAEGAPPPVPPAIAETRASAVPAPSKPSRKSRARTPRRTFSADRLAHVRLPLASASIPAPALPEAPPVAAPASVAALPHVIATRLGPSRTERVVAYVKPAPGSSVRHAFSRVLGGRPPASSFVAANPVDHPMPAFEAGGPMPESDSARSLEMVAKVDRAGKVVHVKVRKPEDPLAVACATALYRWKFDPARQNGAPVDSEMLVRFEFTISDR